MPDARDDCRGAVRSNDRRHTARQGLGTGHDIGLDAEVLIREPLAGPPEARLDLIEDQERTMPVADFANGPEISLRRRHASGGSAHDRLGDERGDMVGAEALEFRFQFRRQPRHEIRLGFAVAPFMIGESRRYMAESRRQ